MRAAWCVLEGQPSLTQHTARADLDSSSRPKLFIVITVSNLTKQFGPLLALRGIDLDIRPGEFVTIVGPNGAGKTTLLRILATLSRPSHGHVSIAGHVLPKGADEARRQIGLLS